MKITLDIKNHQYQAFLKLIEELDYVSISQEKTVPEWQQEETEKRLKMINNGELKTHNWEDVKEYLFNK